ncbi:MAG: YcnI family protein [Dongiaceae bacterium]
MRTSRLFYVCLMSLAAAAGPTIPAAAHITLEAEEAAANSSYRAVLRVPHGCEGAATTAIRVQVPEGLIVAKPMPKPGWDVTLTEGDYARSYDYFGSPVTKGVTEIAWSGGSLPDNFYDEFIFRVRITDFAPGTAIYLPVVQECGPSATERWIEIPEPGKSADDYEYPAPGLTIIEKKAE